MGKTGRRGKEEADDAFYRFTKNLILEKGVSSKERARLCCRYETPREIKGTFENACEN